MAAPASLKNIVLRNSLWLYVGQVVSKLVKFFLIVYAARLLGPLQYGVFTYTLYLLGLFFLFADLGLSSYLVREYQKNEINKDRLVGITVFCKMALLIINVAGAIFFYTFIQEDAVRSIYFILLTVICVGQIRDIFVMIARANSQMRYEGISTIVESVITTGVGLTVLFTAPSLVNFAISYVFGAITAGIVMILLTKKLYRAIKIPTLGEVRVIFSTSILFLITSIIISLLSQIDIIMLKFMKGLEVVGYYSASLKIVQTLLFLPLPFIVSLFPAISSIATDIKAITAIVRRSTSLLALLGIPIMVGGYLLGAQIIMRLFGPEYAESVAPFYILIMLIPVYFQVLILDDVLLALNYQKRNMQYTFFAALLNILLNFILIPAYSMQGAAIATLIAQAVNLIMTYRLTKRILGVPFFDYRSTACAITASICMLIGLISLKQLSLPLEISILVGGVIYGIVLMLLKEQSTLYLLAHAKSLIQK
ncbi:MAG: flippase [bacterium]|nr:flippase [bacterium]